MSGSRRRESEKSWRRQRETGEELEKTKRDGEELEKTKRGQRERFAGQVQGFYVPWDQLLANQRSSRDQHPALRSAGRFSRNWVSYSNGGRSR